MAKTRTQDGENRTQQARAFLALLGMGSAVHEVRVMFEPANGTKRVTSGRFDDLDRTVAALAPWRDKAHCYVTINPLRGNADNRLGSADACARDEDVSERRWLLVDIDATRAEGFAGYCASDAELAMALRVRDDIATFLEREAHASAVRLRSGNGGTLLYRLRDAARDDGDVKRVLAALAAHFDIGAAHVDRSVSNLSRLTRIACTVNAKPATGDRPRRVALLEHEGPAPDAVSLEALLSCFPSAPNGSRLRPPIPTRAQASIPAGGRNSALMSIAGSMRRLNVSANAIAGALDVVNREACDPPLPAAEVASIASRVAKYDAAEAPDEVQAVVVAMDEIVSRPIRWLWHRYMPLGKLVVIDGDPGLGKSLLTLDIAARVSRGDVMPDGTNGVFGHVVILSAEDTPEDTIRPRLEAAGADLSHVRLLRGVRATGGERSPEIGEVLDLAAIEAAVMSCEAALVIFDPLVAYLGAKINANHDQEVRRALAPLALMAQRTNATVLGIRHLNKTAGVSAIYRGGGSIAISGAARTVLLVGRDPSDPTRRVLAQVKTNLSAPAASLSFKVDAGDRDVPGIVWLGESRHHADDLVRGDLQPTKPIQSTAERFLVELLADGPIAVAVVRQRAAAQGISEPTLERAKKALRVRSRKTGMDGGWAWSLPEDPHVPGNEGLRGEKSARDDQTVNDFDRLGAVAEGDQAPDRRQTMIPFADEADDA